MRPPVVHHNRGGLVGVRGFKQNVSQPRGVAVLKIEGFAEYPRLVPTARVRRAHAIVLDLADIEDSLIAVRQTRHHAGARTSCLVSFSECMMDPVAMSRPVLIRGRRSERDRIERGEPENDCEYWGIERCSGG